MGIAATGTTTGGIVFPLVAQYLLPKVGFGWTVRVMDFIMLGTFIFSLVFTKPRFDGRKTGQSFMDFLAFAEVPYLLFAVGITLCF